jgi:hypothetical protein
MMIHEIEKKQENIHLRLLGFLHHFVDSSIAKTRSAVVPSKKKISDGTNKNRN